MSTANKHADIDMLSEYDFSKAVRGKYYARFKQSSNVVVLDDDVAKLFPNGEAVNGALRALATVAKRAHPGRTTSTLVKRPNKHMQRTRLAQAKTPRR